MKLATYEIGGRRSFGVVTANGICDIPSAWRDGPRDMVLLLSGGQAALEKAADIAASCKSPLPLNSVRLLAPVTPPKLIGLAVNYAEHHREFNRDHDLPDQPHLTTTPRPFLMPHTALANPGDVIAWPCYSETIDYEVELAVVIGATARCVSVEQARGCIAGYTIANDISARTATFAEARTKRPKDDFFDWLHGKWADGFCPLGPWIVTADEVGDPQQLAISLSVNGETRQDARTSQMIFSVYELVSFISHVMTLAPGDVIATGTPSGVGMATGKLLQAGDVMTCRIDKIGELTNTLGDRPESFYKPCLRGRD